MHFLFRLDLSLHAGAGKKNLEFDILQPNTGQIGFGSENPAPVDHSTRHELFFACIETAGDSRSHVNPECLCPFPAEKYSGMETKKKVFWDSRLDTPQQSGLAQTATAVLRC